MWIMALADENGEPVSPVTANGTACVDDFADLLTLLGKWRYQVGNPELSAYALETLEIAPRTPAHDSYEAWERFGPTYRLNTWPGGEIEVVDCRDHRYAFDRATRPAAYVNPPTR